jgi:xylan 1,4-beta-xylosidase
MGSPQNPTKEQIDILEKAGKLKCISVQKKSVKAGYLTIPLSLKRQAVALVTVNW